MNDLIYILQRLIAKNSIDINASIARRISMEQFGGKIISILILRSVF